MTKKWTTAIAASLAIGFASSGQAYAARPTTDYFSAGSASPGKSAGTVPVINTGSFPDTSKGNDPTVKWFEKFDDSVASHRATAADRVILSRPFNQEAERVEQWSETANQVARRYRDLSKLLKSMPVPAGTSGIKDYRDLTADWFSDAASVYEDLTRPRQPARTMEELDAALSEIKERAQSLSQTNANLKAMDMSLRKTYGVHLARYDDAIQQYVRSK